MNILYLGKYKARFWPVINYIKDLPPNSKILELCFGDTYIAEFSKNAGYEWRGIDLNKGFVEQSKKLGYQSSCEDLTSLEILPKADVCIMMGSLYHFHQQVFSILSKMFTASESIILSEPVFNLSNNPGLLGLFAKKAANVGKGDEEFRYNEATLLTTLNKYTALLNYRIVSIQHHGKDLIIKLLKNGIN